MVRVGRRTIKSNVIKSLELDDKVLYREVSSEEVVLYYNTADLLVHPAYHEDLGTPLLEALASGASNS